MVLLPRGLSNPRHLGREVFVASLPKYFSVLSDSGKFHRAIRAACVGCAAVSVKRCAASELMDVLLLASLCAMGNDLFVLKKPPKNKHGFGFISE